MGHIPQSEYAGYQVHPYAYSQYIKGAKPVLMDFLQQGEDWGGTSKVDYDELYRRAKENELKAYYIPDKDLYNRIYEGYGGQGSPSGSIVIPNIVSDVEPIKMKMDPLVAGVI